MISKTLLLGMCVLLAISLKDEPSPRLPEPRYERRDTDPAWLQRLVQFHGHLGPMAVAGARLGMAGLRAADAKGFFDVEVACEGQFAKPPHSCFLDGVQISTGATLGKRNLSVQNAENALIVRVKNTTTGKTVAIRPTAKLLNLLGLSSNAAKTPAKEPDHPAQTGHDDRALERVAREIAALPDEETLTIQANP
jgi:formylmethanofuran dehydrogenase subunit E